MRNLGCFVSVAGGLSNGVKNGEELGVNTIMIHPSPPQRWCTKPFEQGKIDEFNEALENSEVVKRVHMHGIYLINLANPDNQKFHLSKMSIVHYLNLAEKINAPGVVFHTGSFKDTKPEEGFSRIAKGIDWICDEADSTKPLFLECAAGAGGYVVGSKLEHLARIRDEVSDPKRVKFCLDTQHLWASGYDLKNKLDEVVEEIDRVLGLEDVKCVHFNDSKVPFDSKKDRHENLGDGEIGKEAMTRILNHPKLKKLDFVMETPALKSMDTAASEVKKLQSWAK